MLPTSARRRELFHGNSHPLVSFHFHCLHYMRHLVVLFTSSEMNFNLRISELFKNSGLGLAPSHLFLLIRFLCGDREKDGTQQTLQSHFTKRENEALLLCKTSKSIVSKYYA